MTLETQPERIISPVHKVDRQIKRLLGQSDVEDCDAESFEDEDWELPSPEYVFPERVRLVENFYGPEAENFNEDELLARRIQVTKDMVALSQLCEPNRRGNRVNWDIDEDEIGKSEEPLPPEEDSLECPTDVALSVAVYLVVQRLILHVNLPPSEQILSVANLIKFHFAHAHDGISCTWAACGDVPKFTEVTEFLAHAVNVRAYDVNIKLQHSSKRSWVTCSDTSSINSSDASLKSDGRAGTVTPASSVGSEMANIDPMLDGSHRRHETSAASIKEIAFPMTGWEDLCIAPVLQLDYKVQLNPRLWSFCFHFFLLAVHLVTSIHVYNWSQIHAKIHLVYFVQYGIYHEIHYPPGY